MSRFERPFGRTTFRKSLIALAVLGLVGACTNTASPNPAGPNDSGSPSALATAPIIDGLADLAALTPPVPEEGTVPPAEETTPITGRIEIEAATDLAVGSIGAAGGTVGAKGFEIQVPEGSLAADTSFSVTSSTITAQDFGDAVTPLTPLYFVDDGETAFAAPVTVVIPMKIPDGATAMAFSFDDQAGTITPLIPISQDATSLTVGATHFSGLFGALVDLVKLPKIVDSGFRPGVDDWQFTNYGSYASPGGHCEGQSVSAIWYYVTQRRAGGAPALSGIYDNNDSTAKTPFFWKDDSNGYRFASTVNEDPIAVPFTYSFFKKMMWKSPDGRLTYDAFRTAIALSSQPQLIRISTAMNEGGHTMVVYRVEEDRLYVGDPNYPGRFRTIPYDAATGKLGPYSSGDSAGSIAANGATVYTLFAYVPWQASSSEVGMAARWTEFKAGTSGNDVFPSYALETQTKDAAGQEVWVPLVSGYRAPDPKITIRLRDPAATDKVRLEVYRDISPDLAAPSGKRVTIDLAEGANPLGFAEYGAQPTWGQWQYVNFVRLTVMRPDANPTPAAGGGWVLTATEKGGGPFSSSYSKAGEKLTVDSSSGRIAVSYNYDGPPHRNEVSSVSWGSPPASAAPGEAWTSTLEAQGTCSFDIDEQGWAAGVSVVAIWTEVGQKVTKDWSVNVSCQKASESTQLSWTFPVHDTTSDVLEIDASGGDSHGSDSWTYRYQWKP
jgi:hypothetical protein